MSKEQTTTLYIIRHGESKGNALGNSRFGAEEGSTDWGLTETGKEQATKIGKKLEHIPFNLILSSTMLRARQTAEIIASDNNLKIKTMDNIHERSLREYLKNHPDLTQEDLKRQMLNDLVELDDKGKMSYKYSTDMESAQEAASRLGTALQEIGRDHPSEHLLVVTHGNLMRSFLTDIGFAKYNELPSDSIDNTGYAVLQNDAGSFTVQETYGIHTNPNGRRAF